MLSVGNFYRLNLFLVEEEMAVNALNFDIQKLEGFTPLR